MLVNNIIDLVGNTPLLKFKTDEVGEDTNNYNK